MRIAIDLDGVVVDIVGEMLPKLSQFAGRPVSPEDIVEFDIGVALGLSPQQMEELWQWLEQADSYRLARPIDGALAAIETLKRAAEILFVTSRPNELRQETVDWLRSHHLGEFPLVFRPGAPKVLASDEMSVLIEDDPRQLHSLSRVVHRLILLERPWNRTAALPGNCLRLPSWQNVPGVVASVVLRPEQERAPP